MSILMTLSFIILISSLVFLVCLTFSADHILKRVLTLDLIAIDSIGLFLILYFTNLESFYLEIAKLIALVGFVTALVFASFLPESQKDIK
jgi:multisubunit Na+/H+ antiporter MnhF subunit